MKIISVNVSKPVAVQINGREVPTAIYKQPVTGKVKLGETNLEGDQQANLAVHGGPDKAVHAYSADHYAFWQNQFPHMEYNWGLFGENLTIEGLDEKQVFVGDRFQAGTAILEVSECRLPCFKLGHKFGDPAIIKAFIDHQKTGIYLRVIKEGELQTGDPFLKTHEESTAISLSELVRLRTTEKNNIALLEKALRSKALPIKLMAEFEGKL